MAGNTIDWARGSCNIPYAYLFEMRDLGEFGFLLPPEFIQPSVEEIWAGKRTMNFYMYLFSSYIITQNFIFRNKSNGS